MIITISRVVPIVLVLLLMTSCGSDGQSSQGQQSQGYKDTKTMVIDVLKTTEGQKAIQEAGKGKQDKTMTLLSTGEGQQIQMAVKDILTKDTGSKMLEKTMTDPRFAGQFAQAIQSNNMQLHKDLMKDPEYQKSMLEIMNNPEFETTLTKTMKNTVYRQQMMNVIQESMQSPLFKMQLMALLKKVVEEGGVTPKEQKLLESAQGGGGKQSGGSSGGGSDGASKDKKKDKGSQ
jgi:spore germination protein D